MILTVLMLLIYLIIGGMTILALRSRLLDILRIISGVAFLIMATIAALGAPDPQSWLTFALAICVFISIEITGYKEYKGDTSRLFMIHAFTIMLSAVYIIMIITL